MFKRIISANVNGIRSATQKGFLQYLARADPDIVCVQELKAQQDDLSADMKNPNGLHGVWHCAEKKGYSGVAIYSKQPPVSVQYGLGLPEFDHEGRFVRADFEDISVMSLYLPSGSSSPERQAVKMAFLEAFAPQLRALQAENRAMVICGDWNIAHQEIDLKNWKGNLKNSGFLPEERAWMTQTLSQDWVDVWRHLYADTPGYTWWSNRGQAYAKDVGWRIDYHLASSMLAQKAHAAHVYREEKFSDHAPLVVDYAWALA